MASLKSETPAEQQWGCTGMILEKISYKWTIKNIQFFSLKVTEKIVSPSFYAKNAKQKWKLALYPRGSVENNDDNISLFMELLSSEKSNFTIKFDLAIFNTAGIVQKMGTIKEFDNLPDWGFSTFMKRSKLMNSDGFDGTIIVICDMELSTEMVSSSFNGISEELTIPRDQHKINLSQDYRGLFNDPQLSDVTIITRDEKIMAHKAILGARSSVFAAMFKHKEMLENRENEVKIVNMDPRAAKGMLEYIYTGEVTDLEACPRELLAAAEEYDLSGLKALSIDIVRKKLDAGNAAEILMLAHLYNAEGFKKHVVRFIKGHLHDVQKTQAYEELVKYPTLLLELLQ